MKRFENALSGGINNNTRPDLLGESQVVDSNNLIVDKNGVLTIGGDAVYDASLITDYANSVKFWLWRPFRKPYFYSGGTKYQATEFLVYVFYDEGNSKVKIGGFVNNGTSDVYAYFNLSASTRTEIDVVAEPAIAFSGNRMTIVDGVNGTFARFVEINSDGEFIESEVGVDAPTHFVELTNQTGTSVEDTGIAVPDGSFFGYVITYEDEFGIESNPSPIMYNTSTFIDGEDQLSHKDDTFNPTEFISGTTLTIADFGLQDLSDIERINIYRSSGLYTESAFAPSVFSFIKSIPVAEFYTDFNVLGVDAKEISYENDNKVRADDITPANTTLFLTNTTNEVKFPIAYTKYFKLKIDNVNSRTYVNGIIKVSLHGDTPVGFPAEPNNEVIPFSTNSFRFYYEDLTTPIPCLYLFSLDASTGITYPTYHLRIPKLTGNSTTTIYVAYDTILPTVSTEQEKGYMGALFQMTTDSVADFLADSGNHYISRYNVKDENNLVVLGGSHQDNAFYSGSRVSEFGGYDATKELCLYENIILDRKGAETISDTKGFIRTTDNFLPTKVPAIYTAYAWFNLDINWGGTSYPTPYFQVMGEVLDDDGDDGMYLYARETSSTTIQFVMVEWDNDDYSCLSSTITITDTTPHNSIRFFICMSVDSVAGETYLYINSVNSNMGVQEAEASNTFTFSQSSANEQRWFKIGQHDNFYIRYDGDGTGVYLRNCVAAVTDVHYHENLYIDDIARARNIADGRVVFDTAFIGYDENLATPTNTNIEFVDEKLVINATNSTGMLRWSDAKGLVFPTLNELQVGSKIIKVVPRLGTKNDYISILDVYTENGIYILNIDKLSSETKLTPLTGNINSYILKDKHSIVRVGNANYFISTEGLIRQAGESFENLTGLLIDAEFESIAYIKKYDAIGLLSISGLWLYDIKRGIFTKQQIPINSFSDIDKDGYNVIEHNDGLWLYPITDLSIEHTFIKTKTYYVENADLLRFRVEFTDYYHMLIKIVSNYAQIPPAIYGDGYLTNGDLNSGEWYYLPNGFRVESFHMEFNGLNGIGKIEYETKNRGRR